MFEKHKITIVVDGEDRASGPLNNVGSALGMIGKIAGGILAADAIKSIANGIMSLGREALDAYASFERLGLSLQSLMAKELMNASAERTLDMATAMENAAPRAAELQRWIQKLAIESPFKQSDVATAFRMAMAYGFSSDQAQRYSKAMIDFASATGAGGDVMGRISLVLGQIKAAGKLMGQDLLQLTSAGIPVREILAKSFGVTTAELQKMISKGLVPADKAIEAIVSTLENDFGGAAKRQAGTFSGLLSSLSDIKEVGLREFFTGTFKAVQPILGNFVDTLSDPAFMEKVNQVGQKVGQFFTGAITWGKNAADSVKDYASNIVDAWGMKDKLGTGEWLKTMGGALLDFLPSDVKEGALGFIDNLMGMGSQLQTALGPFFSWFKANGPGIFETLKTTLADLVPIILDLGQKVGEIMGPIMEKVWSWLLETIEKIGAWFNDNAPLINDFFQSLRQILVAVFSFLSEAIQFLFQAIANFWPVLQRVFEFVISTLQNIAILIMQVFTADWNAAFETAKTIFASAFSFIWDLAQLFATWILDTFFGYTWEEGKAIIDKAVADISTWFQNLWDKGVEVGSGIYESFTKVRDAIKNIIDKIKEFFDAVKNKTLPDWLKGLLGLGMGGGVDGVRANGGPVIAGKTYLVGERGMELFTPKTSGTIIPNHQLAATGGQTVHNHRTFNINVNNIGGKLNERELAAAIAQWEWAYGV